MACEDRPATHAVEVLQRAHAAPHQFDFFQLLRWLESVNRDRPRIGRAERPADDSVRLGQAPSLAFAPASLSACEPGDGTRPTRVEVFFFGLFGPNGPLPLHLTEYARDRLRNSRDATWVRFADLFHHRMLSLFYRAWADAQPTVQYDRAETDRFSNYVGALLGLGLPSLRNRDEMPDNAKLYSAGLLACQTHHADGLQAMFGAFFQTPVAVEEFVGRWIDLPPDCLCRLGQAPATATLGTMAIAGARVWDCAQTYRIILGPLDLELYLRLLPGGQSLRRLAAMVRNYTGDELGWELELILKKEQVPRTSLGEQGQLGWTTWLACESRAADADDLVLRPVA